MTEQEERDTAPDQSTNPPADTEPAAAAEAPAAPAPEQQAPTAEPEAGVPQPETVEAAPAEPPAPEAEPPPEPAEVEAQAAPESPPEAEAPAEAAPEAAPEADAQAEAAEAEAEAPRPLSELAADARYFATGKRKSSVARVILMPGNGDFKLNGRALEVYFPRRTHQVVVQQPLEASGFVGRVNVVARIHGGGISGQADAVRHGIAKALIDADPTLRGELKRRQLLTRDPRVKERRKAGLKKARKRPQFSKR